MDPIQRLELDAENLKGKLTSYPARDEISLAVDEFLVVEHYSKYL